MAPPLNVAVVVPVRDEAATVGPLVRSLCSQAHRPTEILVVDGGSRDGTAERARAAGHGDAIVSVLEIGTATPGRGRNAGVEASTSPWIAFVDAGIDIDEHWLSRLARFAGDDVDVIYGAYEPVIDGRFSEVASLAYVGRKMPSDVGPVRTRSIASCLLRRSVFDAVGGFPDLRAAEDRIFMDAVEAQGFRVVCSPEAVVRWHLQPTVWRTFTRFRSYSRHNVIARQEANWHYGVARQYALAIPFLLLALRWRRFVVLPVLGFFARGFRSIWLRRAGHGALWAADPRRIAGVSALLAVIDAATIIGWIEGLLARRSSLKESG